MVNIILYIAVGFMALAILLSLFRFLKGPNSTDRIISFDVMTITSIALVGLLAHFANRVIYVDVAMVYGLLSFLGVIIFGRYLERGL